MHDNHHPVVVADDPTRRPYLLITEAHQAAIDERPGEAERRLARATELAAISGDPTLSDLARAAAAELFGHQPVADRSIIVSRLRQLRTDFHRRRLALRNPDGAIM